MNDEHLSNGPDRDAMRTTVLPLRESGIEPVRLLLGGLARNFLTADRRAA